MSNDSTMEDLQSDWKRLEAMEDDDIDTSEIPEITAEQMSKAILRVGGKSVESGKVLNVNEPERDIAHEILDAACEIKAGGGRRFTVPTPSIEATTWTTSSPQHTNS